MLLTQIVYAVNKLVGSNSSYKLPYDKLMFYLDSSIDFINRGLKESFKTIQETYEEYKLDKPELAEVTYPDSVTGYTYTEIPDKYIRSVMCYYAASLYLEEEDETEEQYRIYQSRAVESLQEWLHEDYSSFDIKDSNYDYSLLQPYGDAIENKQNFDTQKSNIINEYIAYYTQRLNTLKAIINPSQTVLYEIELLEEALESLEGEI